ncbi:MAG: hypothetical protein NG740_06420, partial [Omnitrophica bacterium]|nr:hypothetical protein [Candidatus Omnitrophota bacterium]
MKTLITLVAVFACLVFLVGEAAYAKSENGRGQGQHAGVIPPGFSNGGGQKPPHKGGEADTDTPEADKPGWSYHPRDVRGQGNMGNPNMRDPYGFDKDSGRVGSERGRRIEATLDLAGITNAEFTTTEPFIDSLYASYEYWMEQAETNPGHPFAYALAQQYAATIERYTTDGYAYMTVGWIPPHWDPS